MNKYIFSAKVDENGKILMENLPEFNKTVKNFSGKNVYITIEEQKRQRSLSQNKYYWGIVIPSISKLLKDSGNNYSDEEIHEFLKEKFNKRIIIGEDGKPISVIESTSSLTTTGFNNFINKINEFLLDNFGTILPEASDNIIPDNSNYIF